MSVLASEKYFRIIIKSAALFLAAFSLMQAQNRLHFGVDVLFSEKYDLIEGKKIGYVLNTASVFSNGESVMDSLLQMVDGKEKLNLRSFFALEHNINLNSAAGEFIHENKIKKIEVNSLYGKTKKPTAQMLNDIDVVVFDVQDIGTRFYTYTSSLYYILEACVENDVEVIVLDRPNPINGIYLDGPVLVDEFKSFVGIDNLPVAHGMTIGELALFFNDRIDVPADLQVIRMKGWKRDSYWDNYDVNWIDPSPNIVNFETALLYPATVFFEGTNISEGRGTYTPFTIFGAPFIEPEKLKKEIDAFALPYLETREIEFTPVAIEGKSKSPKYEGEICEGVELIVKDQKNFRPVELAVHLLYLITKLYPEKFVMNDYFDLLWGTNQIKESLLSGKNPDEIIADWQTGLNKFNKLRKNYLLY